MTLGLLLIGNNIWLEVMEMDMIGALSTLYKRLVLKPKVRLFFSSKVEF
jgi:hypothetical protein